MPNNRNAAKAMRQANKRRLRNRSAKTSLRSVIKTLRSTVVTAEPARVVDTFNATASKIDKMATKKYIHANKAARLKSRLAKLANKKSAAPAAPATAN
ncbi:MAG: 30S ribosomal protein S20 [Planctomycetota bacterium]|nr:30S ribosomal protein S20 [Planctomycetota bacterium]